MAFFNQNNQNWYRVRSSQPHNVQNNRQKRKKASDTKSTPATATVEKKEIGKITYFPREIIGKGADSKVFRGKLDDGRMVAVKRISYELSDKDSALKEIDILLKCDKHENVVTYFLRELYESYEDDYLFIALELCNLSLEQWVHDKKLNEKFVIGKPDILKQVTKGIEHLHEHNIIHRDLKPENILLLKIKGNQIRVKITDFGISKELPDGRTSKTVITGSGTMGWMAPEILRLHIKIEPSVPIPSKMTRATDIFSLGCIFYYVLTDGEHPFGDNQVAISSNIVLSYTQCVVLENICFEHAGAGRLIQQMIAHNPKERPPASAILFHHLFWSQHKLLHFLVNVSNAVERKELTPAAEHCLAVANKTYSDGFYNPWMQFISPSVRTHLKNKKHRKTGYNENDVMDLVRVIRNLQNHHSSLPDNIKQALGPLPDSFLDYWIKRFPFLIDQVWLNFQKLKNKEEYGLMKYFPKSYMFSTKKLTDVDQKVFDSYTTKFRSLKNSIS